MTRTSLIFLWILPALCAEIGAYIWMTPASTGKSQDILEISFPTGNNAWNLQNDIYQEVQPSLNCSAGWIADVRNEDLPEARVSFFRWDATTTANTLEAFKHLPEQCMGAIGMELEKIYPPRVLENVGGNLKFDSTQFRPKGGGRAVHIFKCVWVEGFPNSSLRDDALLGKDGNELRQLRVAAAIARFRPQHTRVIMGGILGMPSEELAWNQFSRLIEGNVKWRHISSHSLAQDTQ